MPVVSVLKMGDPRLQLMAEKITAFDSTTLLSNIADMIDTMRYYNGVGLAAPQIGITRRIIILEVCDNPRYPEAESIELDVLINPEIIEISEETESEWEGCLSLPGLRGKIQRAREITYQAFNIEGESYTACVQGFHARIIQHEVDHLNGILYPQRLESLNQFGFEDSLPEFLDENLKSHYPGN